MQNIYIKNIFLYIAIPFMFFLLTACGSDSMRYGPSSSDLSISPSTDYTNDSLSDVTSDIGTPDVIQNDGPAKVLIYRSPKCVAAFFLYKNSNEDTFKVKRTELRKNSMFTSDGSCLSSIQSSH